MDNWRNTTWALALLLTPSALIAESLQDAFAYCQSQQADARTPCHVQPCPCTPGETKLKQFEALPPSPALCACAPPLAERYRIRQQAVDVCDDYRRNQHQTCFISRGGCPRGFESLADFIDGEGNRISACRDDRHQQQHRESVNLRGLPRDELLDQYDQLIGYLESRQDGPPKPLPESTRITLDRYFSADTVKRLSLMSTQALSRGCFSDCERIFCADNGQIDAWTDPDHPTIDRNLLHQLDHSARCQFEGGRERFVLNWFEHLPDDVYETLHAHEPLDADRIHFAMYMESHADSRASSLCRRLPGCVKE